MQKISILILSFLPFFSTGQAYQKLLLDSITTSTSNRYSDPSVFKRFFLGANYRKEWETPVKLPVFDLKGMGFTMKDLGGGQQTKSLRLEDKDGKEWVLRTVDKDVEKALPNVLRHTLAQKVTQDMVSAAHPFAPVTVAGLAKAMGIIVPTPTFYAVPDDPHFDSFQKLFAGTVCLLEQREPTPNNSATKSTEALLENLGDQNDHLVMQQAVLKARLLDMLIGDWDRHADQWRWGMVDSGRAQYYYAIPRDRDQAFFESKGVLLKLARVFGLRHLVGFKNNLRSLNNLNYKSWRFDATLLNDLDKADWMRIIAEVQTSLADKVIDSSVKLLPPEIYPISGPGIAAKLKKRRAALAKMGIRYYRFISKSIEITASNEAELFLVSGAENGVLVQVFEKRPDKVGRKIYERVFHPRETLQIKLNGLGGGDSFIVTEEVQAAITLKLYGGAGADIYSIRGPVKNKIYDTAADGNKIEHTGGTRLFMK